MGAKDHLIAEWSTSYAGIWTQWAGILAGPIAWSAMLGFDYALTKWSCGHATAYVLQIIAVAAIGCTLAGAYAAWRTLMLVPAPVVDDGGHPLDRSKFMGLLGLASSALFALLLVAESVPIWTLHGVCW
ncbi:MAG TPA: hypothetical protein VFB07_04505 [Vicinamibacterales bacterium]|nr:hypothetical protein [Vicinamibacterales bacterium]